MCRTVENCVEYCRKCVRSHALPCLRSKVSSKLELAVGTVVETSVLYGGEMQPVTGIVTCVYPYEDTADTLEHGGIIASTDSGWSVSVCDGVFPQKLTVVAKGTSGVQESMRSWQFARQVSGTRERTRNAALIADFNAAKQDIDQLTKRYNRGEILPRNAK